MQITLKKAVHLKSIISGKIQELIRERNESAYVDVVKGEEYEKPTRTIDEVTHELEAARTDYRKLDVLATKANLTTEIVWNGEAINLVEALELAKQTRGEHSNLQRFGNSKKQQRQMNFRSDNEYFTVALFEPQEYKVKAEKIKRRADKLSDLIDEANLLAKIEFASAAKYIEE